MRAIEALRLAHEKGIRLDVDGTDLIVEADHKLTPQVVEALRQNKAGIISLLAPNNSEWSPEDLQAFYDERAGIAEHDGRQTREQAEATAYECCVTEWLNRHPETSQPDCCAWCAKPGTECSIVPFLAGDGGHTWLHPECWEVWHRDRREKAQRALAAMGLVTPPGTAS